MTTDLGHIKLPLEVPGFLGKFEMTVLAHLAKHVPKNKKILEIGSLYGRSTLTLLMNSHESVIVNSIDSFETYHDLTGWVDEHFSNISGTDEDLKRIALDLTLKNKRFLEGFNYFTKGYKDSNRLRLRIEKSQESNFNEKLEILLIDGDHYIVSEDIMKFHQNVEGLIISHDLNPYADYGHAVFKSAVECSRFLNLPFTVFPRSSFFFFCKSEHWRDILTQTFERVKGVKPNETIRQSSQI